MEEIKTYTSVEDLIKSAEEQYTQFIKSDKYKDLLLTLSNINCYSLNNQILILSQKPDAKCVNGLKMWNSNGRNVIKGEKSLKIIAPLIEKSKEDILDENGNVIEEKENEIRGYKVSYVFDISQTEGRELHEFKCDQKMVIEHFEKLKTALEEVPRGFSVEYQELPENQDGYCDFNNKKIVVKDGMNYEQTLTTLIHEIGHALAETRYRNDFNGLTLKEKRQIREIEAESIALVVSNRLGLETNDFNMSYIATWSDGDIEKFKDNISVVRSVSYQILSKLEPVLQNAEREKIQTQELAPVSDEIESTANTQEASKTTVEGEKKAKSKAKSSKKDEAEIC